MVNVMKEQYVIAVEDTFSAAHRLREYEGRCARIHGHNWKVRAFVESTGVNAAGMVLDFNILKTLLKDILEEFDHQNLNDIPVLKGMNPTAENIARTIFDRLAEKLPPGVLSRRIEVWESERHMVSYGKMPSSGE
jgi:6-pyruvoyltetrahydropterin/6-carboxytetrahydropterin synthase